MEERTYHILSYLRGEGGLKKKKKNEKKNKQTRASRRYGILDLLILLLLERGVGNRQLRQGYRSCMCVGEEVHIFAVHVTDK